MRILDHINSKWIYYGLKLKKKVLLELSKPLSTTKLVLPRRTKNIIFVQTLWRSNQQARGNRHFSFFLQFRALYKFARCPRTNLPRTIYKFAPYKTFWQVGPRTGHEQLRLGF